MIEDVEAPPSSVRKELKKMYKLYPKRVAPFASYYAKMHDRFQKFYDILTPGKHMIVIIGKTQKLRINSENYQLEVAKSLSEIGQNVGFKCLSHSNILLAKSSYGAIFEETIIDLLKES